MPSKRPRFDRHEKSKKSKPQAKTSNLGPFVSENARYLHSILDKKQVISSKSVVLNNFEHLNLAQILRANSLEVFVSIKE